MTLAGLDFSLFLWSFGAIKKSQEFQLGLYSHSLTDMSHVIYFCK